MTKDFFVFWLSIRTRIKTICSFHIIWYCGVFWLSIRTRIKTWSRYPAKFLHNLYFDYPLEQGLRQHWNQSNYCKINVFWLSIRTRIKMSLRPGDKPMYHVFCLSIRTGLEQGLRQFASRFRKFFAVFCLSIKTRIKTENHDL